MKFGEFISTAYEGTWYGPFNKKDAKSFAYQVKTTHENFINGY